MQCHKCQYPLWNLREPRCPECGEAFDVMSFWFEPGTVVFKCPYCDHPHQGRDMRGLPFDAGRCEGCGQMLVVEQMLVEPVAGQEELRVREDRDLMAGQVTPMSRRALWTMIIALALFAVIAILAMLVRVT